MPVNILPVCSVEQRLLELNRQSAAARGRLLELIEQQKQNVSAKVSPAGSPIPPSAFSPQSAGMSGFTLVILNCMEEKKIYPFQSLYNILRWRRKSRGVDVAAWTGALVTETVSVYFKLINKAMRLYNLGKTTDYTSSIIKYF